MAGISDDFITETIGCFENFHFEDLDESFIHCLWQNQFSTLEEYPLSEENNIFGEGLFEPITNAIIICEKWATQGNPEKNLSFLESSNESSSEHSKILWTILSDNGIETKYVLGFLYVVCTLSIKNDAPLYMKEMGLKCAKLYLIMLRISGSAAYSVFHPSLLKLVFECFKFPKEKVPSKKRPPTSAFRNDVVSKRKRIRREDEFQEVEEEPAEDNCNETLFGQKECDDILDAFSNVLASVILLFQSFSLSNNVELQEHIIEKLCECAAVEIRYSDFNFNRTYQEILELKRRKGITYVVTGLAYCALLNLCQPLHGNVEDTYIFILQSLCNHILCSKARNLPNPTIPHKFLVIKDNALDFVCYNLDKCPKNSVKCSRVLIQKLCSRCCDKSAFREKTSFSVLTILKHFPLEAYAEMVEWLVRFATQKPSDKSMALDVISLLIAEPVRKITRNIGKKWLIYTTYVPLVHTIIGRCSDKAPLVRAKALTVLSGSLKTVLAILKCDPKDYLPQYPEEDIQPETNGNMPIEASESPQNNNRDDDEDFIDDDDENEPSNSEYQPHQEFNMCNMETFVDVLLTRAADFKVHVRKSALQAVQQLLLLEEKYVTEKFLNFFDYGSRDANITVRRTAVECLSKLLKQYHDNSLVQKFWLNNILATALDAEKSVQTKTLEEMEPLFLPDTRTTAALRQCSWVMLNNIACGDHQDLFLYVKKSFSIWKTEQKLKSNLCRCLETEFGTANEPAAWMLLDILSSQIEIKNMTSILKAWEVSKNQDIPTSTRLSMLSVIAHGCKYMKSDQLKNLQEYFEEELRSFNCHHKLIPNTTVTLLKTYKAQHKNNATAVNQIVNRFASELVQKSEQFLTDFIAEKEPSKDVFPDDLICRHLITIGEMFLLDPHQATDKLCLILQGIIVSSSTTIQSDIGSDHCFETLKYSPKVQSFACLSLGKLCLIHEESAKKCVAVFNRELSTSKYPEVRITIVTIFSDLCVRYTLMVDRYIPSISNCLRDDDAKIRLHTLAYLSRLLQEDYIKLKESLLCRLLVVTIDPVPAVRSMVDYCLGTLLAKRHPTLFIQHFVECIFYLNCCEGIPGIDFKQKDIDAKLFSLPGKHNAAKRLSIYNFMIKYTVSAKRSLIVIKLCTDILHSIASNGVALNKTIEAVIKDCFAVLNSDELKPSKSQESVGDDGEESESSEDKLSKASHKISVICAVIPVLVLLKKVLTELKSPLVSDLLRFLVELCKDYKNEVKDVLATDKQLADELDYEIKKYESKNKQHAPVEIEEEVDAEPPANTSFTSVRNQIHNMSIVEKLLSVPSTSNPNATKYPVVSLSRLSSSTVNKQNADQQISEPQEQSHRKSIKELEIGKNARKTRSVVSSRKKTVSIDSD